MRALRNTLFSNLGLIKFSTFWKFQNSFLHLIFRYLNSARDFLPIDINFNVKIKCYGVPYLYLHFWCPALEQGAKWQNMKKYSQLFSVVTNGKIWPKKIILQIRVFRDLLLFHMIYDFILDTSGSKRTMSHFLCLISYL